MAARIEEPVHFAGAVTFGTSVTFPSGSITGAMIASNAAIGAEKHQVRTRAGLWQGVDTATVVDEKRTVHVMASTGKLRAFKVGVVTACIGNATITVDLQKNGSNVANGQVVLDNANAAGVLEAAPLGITDLVAGDRLAYSVTVNAGTGTLGKGLFGFLETDEDPA